MFILTNISQDVDGRIFAGKPTVFASKKEAIKNAKNNLADDFGITLEEVDYKAQESSKPYVISFTNTHGQARGIA